MKTLYEAKIFVEALVYVVARDKNEVLTILSREDMRDILSDPDLYNVEINEATYVSEDWADDIPYGDSDGVITCIQYLEKKKDRETEEIKMRRQGYPELDLGL